MKAAGQSKVVATARGAQGHSMLFLASKAKATVAAEGPAAALTIHSSLSGDSASPATSEILGSPSVVADKPAAVEVANNFSSPGGGLRAGEAKNLLAQLAPDRLIAQGDNSVSVTPIPPVVSGTVDLEEFKSSNVIDLKVSQSVHLLATRRLLSRL
jgi:hypothetical protein